MALRPVAQSPFSTRSSRTHFENLFFSSPKSSFLENFWRAKNKPSLMLSARRNKAGGQNMVKACAKLEEKNEPAGTGGEWGKVSAVLFDMDGVLCNSEEPSRLAAVELFAEMGVEVTVQDFVPFTGTGEANFLGGVASVKGVKGFNTDYRGGKEEIFRDISYAKANSGIGFPGAYELIVECKNKGLKVAVASNADRIKVDVNLAAAGLQLSMFDAIVSADAFENLKPAPDIFLAAAKFLDVPPSECVVIEDALAGVQAAKSASMRFQGSRRDILRYGSLGASSSPSETGRPCNIHLQKLSGICFLGPAIRLSDQKFVNYMSDLDKRGNCNTVPEFPSKLDWLNTAPLQLQKLGTSSWPTLALVGPNGKLIAQVSGEGYRKQWSLVTVLDGNFKVQIGSSGEEGFRDGNFDDAMFNRPQGLAYNAMKNLLYVADTENHALSGWLILLMRLKTLARNGTKGSDCKGGGSGTTQRRMTSLLNSPWDESFEPSNEIVYIAMAGNHQIWKHSTLDGTTRAFSGDGYERNLNGASSGSSSFAQPSGISLSPDLKEAYIADSESSSIRALDLGTGGSRLLAGGDPLFSDNLFKFGDHDGVGSEVLLQHPLGVFCGNNGQVYVADSYNHKIKKLDLASRRATTIAGNGKAGFKDGSASEAQCKRSPK
ncbi:hypothetical protein CASFOL_017828 [Castilleja foliolosa]|uniref:Uncharacterized protein n=1 Tax=Castilleja foliolosa TaxID=1961234 RepID=A0ABD3D8X4_9LAMI